MKVVKHKINGYEGIINSTAPIAIYALATSNNTILDELKEKINESNYTGSSK